GRRKVPWRVARSNQRTMPRRVAFLVGRVSKDVGSGGGATSARRISCGRAGAGGGGSLRYIARVDGSARSRGRRVRRGMGGSAASACGASGNTAGAALA